MSKVPTTEIWMPLHFAEFNKAVSRMSPLEECAYGRLLRDYWLNGAPPADDDTLAKIVRFSRREWLKVRDALADQFVISDRRWTHTHLDSKRAHAKEVSSKRAAAATQKQPQDGSNCSANAPQLGTHARLDVPISVPTEYPSQEVSSDSQVSTGAKVIPLDGRGGR